MSSICLCLQMFMSKHYAGSDIYSAFREGEEWKKVFGPYMIYLNSDPRHHSRRSLWEDAKNRVTHYDSLQGLQSTRSITTGLLSSSHSVQMMIETDSWPYSFVRSKDYPHSGERGSVSGQLLIRDRSVDLAGLTPILGTFISIQSNRLTFFNLRSDT